MAIDIPAKLYVEKLFKDSRSMADALALLPGPVKSAALHAMAERVASDRDAILTANGKDVETVGKSFGEGAAKERMKAAVAHVRVTAEQISRMVEQLHQIAELPDPVGLVVSRQERPDGLQVSRVRVPIGVLGVLSERSPLITVESIALGLKSGNFCLLRTAPEWRHTHQAIDAGLREAAAKSGIPSGAWVLIDRQDKDVAIELMRAAKGVDALIVRGGAGLRKAVAEQARVPVLCDDGGLTHLYVDGDTDIPMAQNLVINSKVQQPGASNSLDTLLVQQVIGRQFLPPLINRLLDQFKVEVHACPKTVALMGQMAMTGHTAIVPATEADWRTQFAGPTLAIKMVEGLDEALAHIAAHRPCLTAVIATNRYESAMRFTREVDAGAVLVNASTRLHAGESFGMGQDIGLSVGKLHAKGPIGPEQLTCEKYVAFGSGQLRLPHPVPETYFDAIMLKRP
ncbi:MAG: gamma-glutamyl phosphate reductase [Nitrospira sp. HN-bin3]|uniref:glutamate-5-semialdehyde dehydrogenase n=1 Tax=Nitrospira cf. moscoviensis SBR1015 TaxID=96242 RepID=UPI000A0DAADB|nr:glutamate-5-semialdehyde dehydrogenase [Nitrospira cf. moscoviensis SBR1015]OQW42811.1 MAG: gamma-glutamyl phosphate reductase [Nitrospira sp. HN-bin3]